MPAAVLAAEAAATAANAATAATLSTPASKSASSKKSPPSATAAAAAAAATSTSDEEEIAINRGPVLSLWAAAVAQRIGYSWDTATTVGRALADQFAKAKGQRLGVVANAPRAHAQAGAGKGDKDERQIRIFDTSIDMTTSTHGLVAVSDGIPWVPRSAQTYLRKAFGSAFDRVRARLEELAATYSDVETLNRDAYNLYCQFRPAVPDGVAGWGQRGTLRMADISRLIRQRREGGKR